MDSDERALLLAVAAAPPGPGVRAAASASGLHPKRACYLLLKWSRKGWYAYGVSHDLGWLTSEGRAAAEGLR